MQVKLVLLVVAGPGNLLEAIGFGVDELGILGDGLVGVPDRQTERQTSREKDKERVREKKAPKMSQSRSAGS